MLFHTWVFAAFLLVVYPVYLLVKNTPLRLPWLLAASYLFYGWWNPYYLTLIVWSTSVDYAAVLCMARSRRRRLWLAVSVVNNISLLFLPIIFVYTSGTKTLPAHKRPNNSNWNVCCGTD